MIELIRPLVIPRVARSCPSAPSPCGPLLSRRKGWWLLGVTLRQARLGRPARSRLGAALAARSSRGPARWSAGGPIKTERRVRPHRSTGPQAVRARSPLATTVARSSQGPARWSAGGTIPPVRRVRPHRSTAARAARARSPVGVSTAARSSRGPSAVVCWGYNLFNQTSVRPHRSTGARAALHRARSTSPPASVNGSTGSARWGRPQLRDSIREQRGGLLGGGFLRSGESARIGRRDHGQRERDRGWARFVTRDCSAGAGCGGTCAGGPCHARNATAP